MRSERALSVSNVTIKQNAQRSKVVSNVKIKQIIFLHFIFGRQELTKTDKKNILSFTTKLAWWTLVSLYSFLSHFLQAFYRKCL